MPIFKYFQKKDKAINLTNEEMAVLLFSNRLDSVSSDDFVPDIQWAQLVAKDITSFFCNKNIYEFMQTNDGAKALLNSLAIINLSILSVQKNAGKSELYELLNIFKDPVSVLSKAFEFIPESNGHSLLCYRYLQTTERTFECVQLKYENSEIEES